MVFVYSVFGAINTSRVLMSSKKKALGNRFLIGFETIKLLIYALSRAPRGEYTTMHCLWGQL